MVGLLELDHLSLLLSSDDEVADLVSSGSEDSILVDAEVELHVLLIASLLIPAAPQFLRVHLESEAVAHALELPPALDDTAVESAGVVHGVLALVLLDEAHLAVRCDLARQSELADRIAAAADDRATDVDLQVLEPHVLLLAALAVVALPADDLVRHLAP